LEVSCVFIKNNVTFVYFFVFYSYKWNRMGFLLLL